MCCPMVARWLTKGGVSIYDGAYAGAHVVTLGHRVCVVTMA
jgi:hypothetical protein